MATANLSLHLLLVFTAASLLHAFPTPSLISPELGDLFEGDIEGIETDADLRNALRDETKLWPGGEIPFMFHARKFTDDEMRKVRIAMEDLENKTCIRFVEEDPPIRRQRIFFTKANGCSSSVGMVERGQRLSLSSGRCFGHGTIQHELMHALGFYHEQSRTDRDEYIELLWDNIIKGSERNFKRYEQDVITHLDAPYDYYSLLHYSYKAWCINQRYPTILPKDPNVDPKDIGQRKKLSDIDLYKINKLYKCGEAQAIVPEVEVPGSEELEDVIPEGSGSDGRSEDVFPEGSGSDGRSEDVFPEGSGSDGRSVDAFPEGSGWRSEEDAFEEGSGSK